MNTHSHMLPCPFCGGRAEFNEHDEKCYFTVLAKAKAAPKGDVSGIAELIPAWNRRIGIDLTRTQWQPIATAPTDGTVVLATLDGSDHDVKTAPQPPTAQAADSVMAPLSDAQWQRIADLTDSILTRSVKDEIERVIGLTSSPPSKESSAGIER